MYTHSRIYCSFRSTQFGHRSCRASSRSWCYVERRFISSISSTDLLYGTLGCVIGISIVHRLPKLKEIEWTSNDKSMMIAKYFPHRTSQFKQLAHSWQPLKCFMNFLFFHKYRFVVQNRMQDSLQIWWDCSFTRCRSSHLLIVNEFLKLCNDC